VAGTGGAERVYAQSLERLVGGLEPRELCTRLLRGALALAEARAGDVRLVGADGGERVAVRRGRAGAEPSLAVALRAAGAALGELRFYGRVTRSAARRALLRKLAAAGARSLAAAAVHESALRRADLDPLTGLANHGRFWFSLEREAARAARYGRALSVVMMDLDFFKSWNDRNGHLAGDAALARAACLVAERSRLSDTAARYGGDEFALVLPETVRAGALTVAEKIRAALEADAPPGAALTLSAGVATAPEDGRTAAELIRAADARLYAAKAGGRNRVVADG